MCIYTVYIYICIYLSIYLPIYLSIDLSIDLSIYLPIYLSNLILSNLILSNLIYLILSYLIKSYLIKSYLIWYYLVLSYLSYLTLPYLTLSYLIFLFIFILSYLIWYDLVLSYLSYLIWPYLTLSYLILSYLSIYIHIPLYLKISHDVPIFVGCSVKPPQSRSSPGGSCGASAGARLATLGRQPRFAEWFTNSLGAGAVVRGWRGFPHPEMIFLWKSRENIWETDLEMIYRWFSYENQPTTLLIAIEKCITWWYILVQRASCIRKFDQESYYFGWPKKQSPSCTHVTRPSLN